MSMNVYKEVTIEEEIPSIRASSMNSPPRTEGGAPRGGHFKPVESAFEIFFELLEFFFRDRFWRQWIFSN